MKNRIIQFIVHNLVKKTLDNYGFKLTRLKHGSIDFIEKEEEFNKDLKVVEIGNYREKNAKTLMESLNIKKLYLIDPYYYAIKDGCGLEYLDLNKAERIARKRMKRYGNKVEFIKKTSDDAIQDIPNDMDYIYIDGNHSYGCVKKDIENYYKKVRVGGIFAGHDAQYHEVLKAVLEFVNKEKLTLYMAKSDWWVFKK